MSKELKSERHETLRLLLIERRMRRGLTQAEVAKRLGWPASTISAIETGQRRVSVPDLLDLAEAIGFDAAAAVRAVERANLPKRQ